MRAGLRGSANNDSADATTVPDRASLHGATRLGSIKIDQGRMALVELTTKADASSSAQEFPVRKWRAAVDVKGNGIVWFESALRTRTRLPDRGPSISTPFKYTTSELSFRRTLFYQCF